MLTGTMLPYSDPPYANSVSVNTDQVRAANGIGISRWAPGKSHHGAFTVYLFSVQEWILWGIHTCQIAYRVKYRTL